MTNELTDVTGFRGERIVELCLTDYADFPGPLFRPGFLGDKWPAIDFYVELTDVPGRRLYFFGQVKTTNKPLSGRTKGLPIAIKKPDVERLLQIPGPTYVLGVHQPTKRVFAQSIHLGALPRTISRIPLAYELTSKNLRVLHDEIRDFWSTSKYKPTVSAFT